MNKIAELAKPFRTIKILSYENGNKSIVTSEQNSQTTWRLNEVKVEKDELNWLIEALKQ